MTTRHAPAAPDSDVPLSKSDFARIAKVAKAGWGLNIDEAKLPLIKSRLGKRLKALGLAGYDPYCAMVEAGDAVECDHFVSALTTNVTHFYRELHHFEHLEKNVLPSLIAKARQGKRVRFWSAGCSSGQEAYSVAGSILAEDKDAAKFDLRILATDIDPLILRKAETGRFSAQECNFPSPDHEVRVFGKDRVATRSVRPDIRALVTFRRLNLTQDWPISGKFDVIFCRNVAIYFDKPTQARLWSRLADALLPGGHLYIGHSERITAPADCGLEPVGITAYRRTTLTY